MSLTHCHGKRLYQPCLNTGQCAISDVYWSHSQITDCGLWSGNETAYAHAYKIRKNVQYRKYPKEITDDSMKVNVNM